MSPPLISVIIPVFNGERFIAEAIQSVLDQKYEPLEIIVIDDGSTDGTADVVKNLSGNIHYFYQKNSGIAAARNTGLRHSKGGLIAFIDADDVWVDNKLALQIEHLNQFPETEIVIGFLLKVPLQNKSRLDAALAENNKGLLVLQLGSTLIKKSVFDKIGGFDEELTLSEDTDWFFRVREADIKVRINKEIVQFYRFHNKNITYDKSQAKLFQLKAYKKSLDRRRKAGLRLGFSLPDFKNVDETIEYWTSK